MDNNTRKYKWLNYVFAVYHSTLQEYISVILKPMLPTMKVGRLSTQEYTSLEVSSCSIEPPRSKRRRPEAVRCPGIVKSTPLLRQTASIVASLAI